MKKKKFHALLAVPISVAFLQTVSHAGSERLVMVMTEKRMEQGDIVHVRLIGKNGGAIESDIIKQMSIYEDECNSGRLLKMPGDYKIGYRTGDMLVGIYLYPPAWKNRPLCFKITGAGEFSVALDPVVNQGRLFQFDVSPSSSASVSTSVENGQ